jgi:hypothetical protein
MMIICMHFVKMIIGRRLWGTSTVSLSHASTSVLEGLQGQRVACLLAQRVGCTCVLKAGVHDGGGGG